MIALQIYTISIFTQGLMLFNLYVLYCILGCNIIILIMSLTIVYRNFNLSLTDMVNLLRIYAHISEYPHYYSNFWFYM